MRGLFVTGTDTGVGKTVVSALLMHALDGDYWKPVQSGLEGETDTQAVRRLTALPPERFHAPAYELRAPLSPHESARRDGVVILPDAFRLPRSTRRLIVEGAGGVLVPLNDTMLMADLMRKLGLPVVLVARTVLGTINHTLLSIEALRSRGIEIAGVALNGPPDAANRSAIERYGDVRIVLDLPLLEPLDAPLLATVAHANTPRFAGLWR
jgi:dethiobiotin synthetase/malonyl-CoA O-methyltransferase